MFTELPKIGTYIGLRGKFVEVIESPFELHSNWGNKDNHFLAVYHDGRLVVGYLSIDGDYKKSLYNDVRNWSS